MDRVMGGHLVARCLKQEGIRCVFTLSGGPVTPIYDGCLEEGIRIIATRHEHTCGYAADAWGRLTRKPGVALLTTGPGHANALAGMQCAYLAQSPALFLAGQAAFSEWERGDFQEFDHRRISEPMVKWARVCFDVKRIPEYMQEAFRVALSGRPGPVYLGIPRDIVRQTCDENEAPILPPARYRTNAKAAGDPNIVPYAVQMIREAQKPVLIAGAGCWWSDAGKTLRRFAELLQVPFFSLVDDVGCVESEHPLYIGLMSARNNGAAQKLTEADVVTLLGCTVDFRFQRTPLNPKAKVIQVDVDPQVIGRNITIEFSIVGDCGLVLLQMMRLVEHHGLQPTDTPQRTKWIAELKAARDDFLASWREQRESDAKPIHPLRLVAELKKFIQPDDIVVFDGGDIVQFAKIELFSRFPSHWLTHGPIGCIGHGTAFALAAKAAFPERRVWLLSGDGALGYGVMEFDVMVKEKLPIVCIVSNDQAHGIVRHEQIQEFGEERAVATELGWTAFEKVVEALGGYGELVEDIKQLPDAIERAWKSGVPACLNVPTQFASAFSRGEKAF